MVRCGLLPAGAGVALMLLVGPLPLAAQRGSGPAPDTGGFVIRDSLVTAKCARCHARDSTGHMGRLSYLRKAPEGWEASVRRMASLSDVKITPVEARAIVKYFANRQGLAPAEVKPARFETERRANDYRYTADANTERTCRACHSVGRVLLQRRTRNEWELLVATHRGYYPNSDFQAFRRSGPSPDSAPVPHPMDQAIAHLSRTFPLQTPEWTAWSATMRPAPLEGTWLLTGYEVGRGELFGRLTVTKVKGTDDEFTSHAVYRYASGGAPVVRDGKSVVYTGHQWRGRSSAASAAANPDSAWREVMSVEPGWQEMSGRWFRGGYDEFGIDISARRATAGATMTGVIPRAIRRGARDVEVTVFGANLAKVTSPGALDFGPGVSVTRIVRSSGDEIVARVNVDTAARIGSRDLVVGEASLNNAIVAYDKVDRIRVTPNSNLARVGGIRFPRQFARFEAVGVSNGPDGKPDTADDITIGAVPVTWSLEEYGVTYKDDDVKYVGTIDQQGFFTPNVDGPNPRPRGLAQQHRRRVRGGVVPAAGQHRASAQGALPAHRHRAAVHAVGAHEDVTMMVLGHGDFHAFEADGARHVYLVPSAAVFRLDGPSAAVLDVLRDEQLEANAIADRLADRFPRLLVQETVDELLSAHAIRTVVAPAPVPKAEGPRKRIPLTTLVMNVTSKCNLSCKYCYEYGEDKISTSRPPSRAS